MRIPLAVIFAAAVSLPLLAGPAGLRIEYGIPTELWNVKNVYISSVDLDLQAEARRQFSQMLPVLTLVESEELSDMILSLTQKPVPEGPQTQRGVVTTVVVARAGSKGTVRLYFDASSQQKDPADAVREVLTPVVRMLQEVNPSRYGAPPSGTSTRDWTKPQIHTTAGLRPGLTKREVVLALGAPTQVFKGSSTEIWTYRTSDGDMRLMFGGDLLKSVTLHEKK